MDIKRTIVAGRWLALVLGLWLPAMGAVAQSIMPRPPDIAGSSYILMDARTGHVIMEENADEPLPPASLTKMMTAYVAEVEIDNGNLSLDDEVYISEKAWRTQGSKMFVDVDSYVPVRDLMRGIIIQSGNDASVAMAEHIAGSEEAFADLMNQHADMLGMDDSSFMNASGLDDGGTENQMSARDLAILARAKILDHPERYEVYAEREFTYNGITQPNRNTLLFRDDSVDGIKTGWTSQAGYCLVASAERDGMRLISVVMGTASEDARAIETQKMLNYGFRFFESRQFYDAGDVLQTERVWSGESNELDLAIGEDVYLTVPRGASDSMTAAVDIPGTIRAPIEAGQVMGTVALTFNDEEIYSGDVVAAHAVERGGLFKRLIDALTLFFMSLFRD
ncbi:MAG: D-alanyl-D-alanine carboxypeptidase family protein [Pseudomonadota bacterium]